jgi:hypothetical protein
MDESERLQRYKREGRNEEDDRILSERIASLLNHPKIDRFCAVDAYYYDFCEIPIEIQRIKNFYRDVYLLFGITTEGEIITKWVERYDLDSDYEIINGEVVRPMKKRGKGVEVTPAIPSEIIEHFDKCLLSSPIITF